MHGGERRERECVCVSVWECVRAWAAVLGRSVSVGKVEAVGRVRVVGVVEMRGNRCWQNEARSGRQGRKEDKMSSEQKQKDEWHSRLAGHRTVRRNHTREGGNEAAVA